MNKSAGTRITKRKSFSFLTLANTYSHILTNMYVPVYTLRVHFRLVLCYINLLAFVSTQFSGETLIFFIIILNTVDICRILAKAPSYYTSLAFSSPWTWKCLFFVLPLCATNFVGHPHCSALKVFPPLFIFRVLFFSFFLSFWFFFYEWADSLDIYFWAKSYWSLLQCLDTQLKGHIDI